MNFFDKVFYVIEKIPIGKVASYGQIGALAGSERAARQVGWALAKVDGKAVPWQRVVSKSGHLTIVNPRFPATLQKELLEKEDVEVIWDKGLELFQVDMKKYLWIAESFIIKE